MMSDEILDQLSLPSKRKIKSPIPIRRLKFWMYYIIVIAIIIISSVIFNWKDNSLWIIVCSTIGPLVASNYFTVGNGKVAKVLEENAELTLLGDSFLCTGLMTLALLWIDHCHHSPILYLVYYVLPYLLIKELSFYKISKRN